MPATITFGAVGETLSPDTYARQSGGSAGENQYQRRVRRKLDSSVHCSPPSRVTNTLAGLVPA
jgi:hypothetical protein